jgi:uncharacterized membrane protein
MPKKTNNLNDSLTVGLILLALIPVISVLIPLIKVIVCPNSRGACELGYDLASYALLSYGAIIYIPLTIILLIVGIVQYNKNRK